MSSSVKTITTISLDKTKRPKVKQVIEGYGLNLNKLHQLLEDYIYQTGELPLFLLKPQTKQIYDATSDFGDYFISTTTQDDYHSPSETEAATRPLPVNAGAFLSKQLQNDKEISNT